MATQKKEKYRHEEAQINKDLTELNPSKEVKSAVKERPKATKPKLTLEEARKRRNYFELMIFKALTDQGLSRKAAEDIISGYFYYQTEVEKKVKKEVK